MTDVIRFDREVEFYFKQEPTSMPMGAVRLTKPFEGDEVILGRDRFIVVDVDRDETTKTDRVTLVWE